MFIPIQPNRVGFNIPHLTGKEIEYVYDAVKEKKLSGNGKYTKLCHSFFTQTYGFKKVLLTTSCTDALEMAAILCNIQPGDEVIAPSYTFVSTVNAFILRGARIVFCDSKKDHPNMDEDSIEALITPKTKVIVPVHYAGVACNMEKIMKLAKTYNIWVVEDAAQALDSYYTFSDGTQKPLGSIGHLGAFSFHETKNIQSGEGGMLAINHEDFFTRSEIIWEKGTNRSQFFRGEVNKYGWMDIGSSFLPSELTAAFLYAQLENLQDIQQKRKQHWFTWYTIFKDSEYILPYVPNYATNNYHMFYLLCKNIEHRTQFIEEMNQKNIHCVFHYLSLHTSPYYIANYTHIPNLPNADRFSDVLVRLPLYYDMHLEFLQEHTPSSMYSSASKP